ncbi:MAG: nucleotide exchange factor GrpE [Clostridia bacterium]|nr:nucleotide exchange factor GrpE [Clostridia bacterium]
MAEKAKKTQKQEAGEIKENEIKTQEAAEKETAEEPEKEQDGETEALKKQLAETNDRLLRTLAEYDNFRKRSQKEKEALYADVRAETINKLLPVADNLERAVNAQADPANYKKGVEMTLTQLFDILSALNVTAFGEKGDEFDPNIHNGVMHEENSELPENSVSEVFERGYKMGDRIIRHATVKVAN